MTNPLDRQVGGNHYTRFKIQPRAFTVANGLSFDQGNVIKYVCRYNFKNGIQDLEKAKHYIEMMIADLKKEQAIEGAQPMQVVATNHADAYDPSGAVEAVYTTAKTAEQPWDIAIDLNKPVAPHFWAFDARRDVVKVKHYEGEGNAYIDDLLWERPFDGGRRHFTSAPVGRYVRQDSGLYLLTERG